MGEEAKKKAERIHRRKLWNGMETAAEVHWKGRGRRCSQCPGAPVLEVIIFCPANEFERNHPKMAVQMVLRHGGKIPVVMLQQYGGAKPQPFVTVGHRFACREHRADLEKFAARAPSSYYCDLKRGPGQDNPIVQGAGIPS